MTAKAVAGTPLPFTPSMADMYRIVLAEELGDPMAPLQDIGSDPGDTIDAATSFGVRPWGPMASDGRYSDADPATITRRARLTDLLTDSEYRLSGDYEIPTVGVSRLAAVCAALDAGHPVTVDVSASGHAFQRYSGGILQDDGGPLDHYTCIMGYNIQITGQLVFHVDNSWGTDWGNAGSFDAAESVILAASDLIVGVEA